MHREIAARSQLILAGVMNLTPIVLYFLYFSLLEGGTHSATFGKRMFGMVVFDKHGEPINRSKAFARAFGNRPGLSDALMLSS